MLVHKSFRYRVYPTAEQQERLGQWDDALRFLWNIANEQRLMGLARSKNERVYLTAFDQINELTELRAMLPWLADVPRNVCAELLRSLDVAWRRCFKKSACKPRFKKKGCSVTLCEPHPKAWKLDGTVLRFPKLGWMRVILHRPLEGVPKTCSLVRDVDQWFVAIICEVELNPIERTLPVIAIDCGVVNIAADSDGNVHKAPRSLDRALSRLKRLGRRLSKKKKGSKNRAKAKLALARQHRKVRRQRQHATHVLSHGYVNSHGTIVVEKLWVVSMVRKAPRVLRRGALDAAWGELKRQLSYKLSWTGGRLIEVGAAYSSQTCSRCGHIDAASRRAQRFGCVACGFECHADVNAAKVLYSRGNPGGAACGGYPVRGPMKQEVGVFRHQQSLVL